MFLFPRRIGMISLFFFFPISVFGVQEAQIKSESASVYRLPSLKSEAIHSFERGANVRISNKSRKGWYRVAIPSGASEKYSRGWIQAEDVQIGRGRDLRNAGIQSFEPVRRKSKRNHFVLFGFGGLGVSQPKAIQDEWQAGRSTIPTFFYGGEVGYRILNHSTLSLRINAFAASQEFSKVSTDGSSESRKIQISGLQGLLVFENTFIHYLPWKMGAAIGLGYVPNGEIKATARQLTASTTNISMFSSLVKLTSGWSLSSSFSLRLNLGYHYSVNTQVKFNRKTMAVVLMGPFAESGLQIEF